MVSHWKANVFWILGTVSTFLGVRMTAGADRAVLGSTSFRYYSALFLGFVLILFGGLLWISVAGAIREEL